MFWFLVVIDEAKGRVSWRVIVFLHSLKRHKINCKQAAFFFNLTAVANDPSKQYIT